MTKRIIALVAVVVLVAAAVVAYSFLKTPEAASSPIVAVPLAATQTVAPEPTATPIPAQSTSTPEPAAEAIATSAPATEVEPTATQESEPAPVAATGPVVFEILQDGSEARFIIQEVLRGTDKRVVGVTNQVAGQIAIDAANPANSQVGVIQVNARTLSTDSDMRNRAVKNQILKTNNFELVTFTPTEIRGLPAAVLPGDTISFQIAGDLTVTNVTLPVVFDVTVTAVSEDRIEGLAETQILWRDFGLFIPDSPSVDTVADQVILQLQFVATPAV